MMDFHSIIEFLLKPVNLWIIALCTIGYKMTDNYIKTKRFIYNYFSYTQNGIKCCGVKNYYTAIHFNEFKTEEFFSEMKTIRIELSPEGDMKCLMADINDKQHVLSVNKIEEFSKPHSK